MSTETIIAKAEFNPKVCTYWLLSGIIICCVTVVGIPFLLIWIPLGLFITRKQLARMECVLTNKALKVKKGVLVRVEKTIPLEKITDMGMVQGPIMRKFDLHSLTVETAGQSAPGSLVNLTGIVDAVDFREKVLNQRDAVSAKTPEIAAAPAAHDASGTEALLGEIRDSLARIETAIDQAAQRDS
jgi:putative membrane protein